MQADESSWNEEQQQHDQVEQALSEHSSECACGGKVRFFTQQVSAVEVAQFGWHDHVGEPGDVDDLQQLRELRKRDPILFPIANILQQNAPAQRADRK